MSDTEKLLLIETLVKDYYLPPGHVHTHAHLLLMRLQGHFTAWDAERTALKGGLS